MKALELNIPDEAYHNLEYLASQSHESVNEFAVRKLEEMARAFAGYQELERRALRGHREEFMGSMAKAPSVPPRPGDAR